MNCESTPEREADYGPDSSGWQPGDIDPNTPIVHAESAKGSPGIAPKVKLVDFGGIFLTVEQYERVQNALNSDAE